MYDKENRQKLAKDSVNLKIEVMQQRIKRKMESPRAMWYMIKCDNICIISTRKKEKAQKWSKK